MNYGDAYAALQTSGAQVRREGWKGFLFLVPGSTFKVNRPPLLGLFPEGTTIKYRSHVDRVFDDGTVGVYILTKEDSFAEDWAIVESEAKESAAWEQLEMFP